MLNCVGTNHMDYTISLWIV